MAYKNVHKRIQRLESLQLIEKVEITESEHGAKYYRLTEAGIYELFANFRRDSLTIAFPKILENYGNLAFFDTFLYPYFAQESLMSFKMGSSKPIRRDLNYEMIYAVVKHLRTCCADVADSIAKTAELYGQPDDHVLQIVRADLQRLETEIGLKSYFLLRIILIFEVSTKETDFTTIKTMSLDNKFMKNVDVLRTFLEKGYKKCMDIGKK
jgi:hypothetical protein